MVSRVSEVHAYTAVVDLVNGPRGAPRHATLEDDTRPISYQGALTTSFGPARGVVEYVPLDILLLPDQTRRLVTSGLGGVFPPGLVIGTLTEVSASADGLFKTGEVHLDPRLAELAEVTVLVPLEPAENKPAP